MQVQALAEINSKRVTEQFAQPARQTMPSIACPNTLDMETLHELTKDSFNAPTHLGQAVGPGLFLAAGRAKGSQQANVGTGQFIAYRRRPVIAVSQHITRRSLQQLWQGLQVMHIGCCQTASHNHARPAHPNMSTQAKVGLFSHLIAPISRHARQTLTSIGPRKTT